MADVTSSWLTDKTVNMLMAKKTPLAFTLSRAVRLACKASVDLSLMTSFIGYSDELACLRRLRAMGTQARKMAKAMASTEGAQPVVVKTGYGLYFSSVRPDTELTECCRARTKFSCAR